MKKLWLCLLALLTAITTVLPALSVQAAGPEITAPSAVLMEASTSRVLFQKEPHQQRPCASITKVMTLCLVFEAMDSGRLSLEQTLTTSAHAASMGGSDIWLEEGETMSVDDLLKATVIMSANDAAVVLAEAVAGSEDAFVEQMNQKAQQLGMNDTVFKNCNGLDEEGHVTSAYDVALMSRELLRHEKIFDYTLTWMDSVRNGETHPPYYLYPAGAPVYDPRYQMPVEECANMLVMFLACYRADGQIGFFDAEYPLAEKWVKYLAEFGLRPENQLCTDDFAGHLKNNINLAIKATVGIAAYAELVTASGRIREGKEYREIAEKFAAEIVGFSEKYGHLPITWDSDGNTFSLKYNLAFDKLLSLGLFPQSLLEKETDFYLGKFAQFGVPLDNRKEYTKSDWQLWAASLTDDPAKKKKFVSALDEFLQGSPDRVPFADWYETETGEYHYFRARSVQGGCFILLLENKLSGKKAGR